MMIDRRQILAASAALAIVPAGVARAEASRWDAALDAAFAGAETPALAAMVVGPDGPLWTGARGVRRAGSEDGVTVEDRWHLGSNTKAMTAALYARLVDQGRANWDAPVASLFPDITADPAWAEASVRSVMGQVAGLTDEPAMGTAWLMTARADPRSLPEQRAALAQAMLSTRPAGQPGTFAYANANYVLLGAAIEAITGQAWEDVMRAELFAPLGITTGGFGAPTGDQPWGHRGAVPVDPTHPGSDNPPAMGPAGTAHMSLTDHARFLRIFLNPQDDWLSPDSRAVLTQAIGTGASVYGGGWMIAEGQPWADGPALAHDGSNTMWYASTWVAPGIGRAFVAVSNDAARGGPACQGLIPGLIRAI